MWSLINLPSFFNIPIIKSLGYHSYNHYSKLYTMLNVRVKIEWEMEVANQVIKLFIPNTCE